MAPVAPVRKRAMQNLLRFGNDVLIKIAYIFWLFSEYNLHVSHCKARYAM